ncbi:MAG: type III-B CRISPR-associated protein Cas10/Cmr2 [Candidatus Njordarchaeales archaeon]
MSSLKDLFVIKILALLHDPLYKSYCIYDILRGKSISHKAEAKKFMESIANGTIIDKYKEKYEDLIRKADYLASGFDRLLLDLAIKTDIVYTKFLANIFNPKYYDALVKNNPSIEYLRNISYEVASILNDLIKEVCSKLGEDEERTIKLSYILLYALLEPLAYIKGLPPSLADTRMPTHTVMDHLYATATAVNMVSREDNGLDGHLVFLDIPGIHDFVSSARKSGDFWAGSWIISEVTWRLIEKIIDTFGPDVLISPTLRANPYFYYKYLKKLLLSNGLKCVYEKVENITKSFLSKLVGRDISIEHLVWQPLIPGTLLLVLPSNVEWTTNKDVIVNKILNIYQESWNELVEDVVNHLREKSGDVVYEVLYKVLRMNRSLIDIPPVGIRIIVINLKEVYTDLIECLKGNEIACKKLGVCYEIKEKIEEVKREIKEKFSEELDLKRLAEHLTFHVAISIYLNKKARLEKIPSFPSYWVYDTNTNKITLLGEQVGGHKSVGWTPCSQCGSEPAILILRKVVRGNIIDYNDKDVEEICKVLNIEKRKFEDSKLHLTLHIRPGEALGPYCLLKRAAYLYALENLSFISTDDIILNSYRAFLTDYAQRNKELVNSLIDTLIEKMYNKHKIVNGKKEILKEVIREALINKLLKGYKPIDINTIVLLLNQFLEKPLDQQAFLSLLAVALIDAFNKCGIDLKPVPDNYVRKICNLDIDEGFYNYCSIIYNGYTDSEKRSILANTLKPSMRYLIIYADGDNVGKIHTGQLPIRCCDYVCSLVKLINRYGISKDKKAKERIKTSYSCIAKILEGLHGDKYHIPISLTYKSTLSASIMITTLKDIVTIKDKLLGMTIFSGGDDVIALAPVDAISNVILLRKNYEGIEGFHKFDDFPIISAIPYGRSISVRIVNLFDLMSEEIMNTGFTLEREAKSSKWLYNNVEWYKDTLALSFSRDITVSHIPLRIADTSICEQLAMLFARLYISLMLSVLSSSLPEDFNERYGKVSEIISKNTSCISRIMDYLFNRNVQVNERLSEVEKEEVVSKLLGKEICVNKQKTYLFDLLIRTYRYDNRNAALSSIIELIKLLKLLRILRRL